MDSLPCPYCGSSLPERPTFCPQCTKQVRCRACRDLLEPNARACVSCGTLVGDGNADAPTSSAGVPDRAVNRLRFEETRASRSLEVSATDEAVSSLGGALGMFLAGRLDA